MQCLPVLLALAIFLVVVEHRGAFSNRGAFSKPETFSAAPKAAGSIAGAAADVGAASGGVGMRFAVADAGIGARYIWDGDALPRTGHDDLAPPDDLSLG